MEYPPANFPAYLTDHLRMGTQATSAEDIAVAVAALSGLPNLATGGFGAGIAGAGVNIQHGHDSAVLSTHGGVVHGEGTGSAAVRTRKVQRKPYDPARCQVDGCGVDLSDQKAYLRRYSVCEEHFRANTAPIGGVMLRFCQQCNRFQDPRDFIGQRRSCRMRSEDRNARRRQQRRQDKLATDASTSQADTEATAPMLCLLAGDGAAVAEAVAAAVASAGMSGQHVHGDPGADPSLGQPPHATPRGGDGHAVDLAVSAAAAAAADAVNLSYQGEGVTTAEHASTMSQLILALLSGQQQQQQQHEQQQQQQQAAPAGIGIPAIPATAPSSSSSAAMAVTAVAPCSVSTAGAAAAVAPAVQQYMPLNASDHALNSPMHVHGAVPVGVLQLPAIGMHPPLPMLTHEDCINDDHAGTMQAPVQYMQYEPHMMQGSMLTASQGQLPDPAALADEGTRAANSGVTSNQHSMMHAYMHDHAHTATHGRMQMEMSSAVEDQHMMHGRMDGLNPAECALAGVPADVQAQAQQLAQVLVAGLRRRGPLGQPAHNMQQQHDAAPAVCVTRHMQAGHGGQQEQQR